MLRVLQSEFRDFEKSFFLLCTSSPFPWLCIFLIRERNTKFYYHYYAVNNLWLCNIVCCAPCIFKIHQRAASKFLLPDIQLDYLLKISLLLFVWYTKEKMQQKRTGMCAASGDNAFFFSLFLTHGFWPASTVSEEG